MAQTPMDLVWKRVAAGTAELRRLSAALDAAAEARDEALALILSMRAKACLEHVEWMIEAASDGDGAAPSP